MSLKTLRVLIISIVFSLGILAAYVSWRETIVVWNFQLVISNWWQSWLQNFSTGMFGTLATYILIELIVEGREKKVEAEKAESKEAGKERKERRLNQASFVEQLKKAIDLFTKQHIVDEMRNLDMLEEVNFWQADLDGINLRFANLKNAYMIGAVLINADLEYSILIGADLQFANLTGAKTRSAKLAAANLTNANLLGASMVDCQFSHDTVLPDGTKWNEKVNMERFTNPAYPNFWRHPTMSPD